MKPTRKVKNPTQNIFSLANLAAAAICLAICHGQVAAEEIFADGEYWIGSFGADPLNIQPGIESGELEIAANVWTHTGESTHGGPFTHILTIDSTTPEADGYVRIQGTQDGGEAFDVTVAVTPTLVCETQPTYEGNGLSMTLVLPKADNPIAADFDGQWVHAMFMTEVGDNDQNHAFAWLADMEIDAASGTGTHQNPDGSTDPFSWTVNSAAATVSVEAGGAVFDIGIAAGGMMFRAGWAIGESDPDRLSMDLFIKTGAGRDPQEAVGRYAVQMLMSDAGLSSWDTQRAVISINADGTYHIDFQPDAMGYDPGGGSDDGVWSMDDAGRISFQSQEGGNPVIGQLSLTGDVILAADPPEDPADQCSLIIATHIAPEPATLILLISAGLLALPFYKP